MCGTEWIKETNIITTPEFLLILMEWHAFALPHILALQVSQDHHEDLEAPRETVPDINSPELFCVVFILR